jgi:hypothetical protein
MQGTASDWGGVFAINRVTGILAWKKRDIKVRRKLNCLRIWSNCGLL